MKTVINPTDQPIRAVSDNGIHIAVIQPGDTRTIHETCYFNACAAGCQPAGENAREDNPATELDEAKVIMLESVIGAVLDEGDLSLLTRDGCPKASVLKQRFGDHTALEREQAFENVKAQRVTE